MGMTKREQRPNIVFILSDDQGAWAMGCAGNGDIRTPNLDRLAEDGVRFDEFYCASPVCSPARASIVTGKMPSCHGVLDWIEGGNVDTEKYPEMAGHPRFSRKDQPIEYLEGHKTYIEELATNGYVCGLSGKWHLGNNAEKKKGFEKWYTIGAGGCSHYFDPDICEDGVFSAPKRYITDLITEKAVEYIGEFSRQEKPFYLSVHYTAPHSPWEEEQHKKEYLDWYKDCSFTATPDLPVHPDQVASAPVGDTPEKRAENLRGYYAAISAMDAGIGTILSKLEQEGLSDNTIVIFTADNGMNMGHHGIWGKGNGTYPQNMYDTAIKVPLIIRMPGGKKGAVCHQMASQYDFYPTMLELAGCSWEKEPMQPGKSIVSLIRQPEEEAPDRVVVFDEYSNTRMIRTKKWKYVDRYPDGPNQLFDMEKDPEELENLYGNSAYEGTVLELKAAMERWFDAYTKEENDGRKYKVTGSGQLDRCGSKTPFDLRLEYYYGEKKGE